MSDSIRRAHEAALLAAACGDGTIGGQLSKAERQDIYWERLAQQLWARRVAEAVEDSNEARR